MKNLIALALFAFLSLAALAAEPAVTVNDLGNIRLGGVNAGSLEDVLANYPARAAEARAAVKAHVEAAPTAALIARAEAKGVTISAAAKAQVKAQEEAAAAAAAKAASAAPAPK